MADARFEDGSEGPLRLIAQSGEDVSVLAALLQDAVLTVGDMRYDRPRRRFAALVNRFRWEDKGHAETAGRPYERVRSLLTISDVTAVRLMGVDQGQREDILSILSLDWVAGEDGTGRLTLILSGDGAIGVEVETVEISLTDVTKPYYAPSRKAPAHES